MQLILSLQGYNQMG